MWTDQNSNFCIQAPWKGPRVLNFIKLPLVVCQGTKLHQERAILSLVPANEEDDALSNILTVCCDTITFHKLVFNMHQYPKLLRFLRRTFGYIVFFSSSLSYAEYRNQLAPVPMLKSFESCLIWLSIRRLHILYWCSSPFSLLPPPPSTLPHCQPLCCVLGTYW